MEGGDGVSEDGSGDVPWTARDQADHDFKMARERSRQMELELELAKLRPASPSGSLSLSDEPSLALQHYREKKAVGRFYLRDTIVPFCSDETHELRPVQNMKMASSNTLFEIVCSFLNT
ncbi:hypothetical protein MRX96_013308 [Rhipicephalus microplus]